MGGTLDRRADRPRHRSADLNQVHRSVEAGRRGPRGEDQPFGGGASHEPVHYGRRMSDRHRAPRRPPPRPPGRWATAGVLVACAGDRSAAVVALTLGVQLEELPDATHSGPGRDAWSGLPVLDLLSGAGRAWCWCPCCGRRAPLWAALLVAGTTTVFRVLAGPAALVTVVWVAARRNLRDMVLVGGTVVVAAVAGERLSSAAARAAGHPRCSADSPLTAALVSSPCRRSGRPRRGDGGSAEAAALVRGGGRGPAASTRPSSAGARPSSGSSEARAGLRPARPSGPGSRARCTTPWRTS